MSLIKDVKICALNSVVNPSDDDTLRRIFREYSKMFYTPLHQVYNLPTYEVLREYFEELYSKMEDHQIEEEIDLLLETESERKERIKREDLQDYSDYDFMYGDSHQPVSIKKKEEVKPEINSINKEPNLDNFSINELPPEINWSFDDNFDFEQELNQPSIGIMPPVKSPKNLLF